MPLYMDVHEGMEGLTDEAMAAAHAKDLEVQGKHGVNFTKYWWDAEKGMAFCLCEAPNMEAAQKVHEEAGHPASAIYEVSQGE